jgi:Skp family chaperone for outer membrane proteins
MTENVNDLLVVFEERMHDLMKLCDDRKKRIESLESVIKNREEEIQKANQTVESLQAKYNYLLAARRVEVNEAEYRDARKQVNKLVREVETCMALLNE